MYEQIARNKRKSVFYILVFFAIWVGIGALLGILWGVIFHFVHTNNSYYSNGSYYSGPQTATGPIIVGYHIIIGMVICFVLAIFGVIFTFGSGANFVLRTSGAYPADPVQYQRLHDVVEALAIGDGLPKPTVYVINDPSPNAFATGISPNKASITFTTGLLAMMNREELEGVAAHEMSHIKNFDIRLILVVTTLIGMAALLASIGWRTAFYSSMGRGRDNNQIVLVVIAAAVLLGLIALIVGPIIKMAISRSRESLADVSGVELTRNPVGLISALQKLEGNDKPFAKFNHATAAMCIDDPLQHHEGWFHHLFDSHPPIADRIANLQRIASGQSI